MARELDLSKPLSKKVIEDLRTRHTDQYVDRMIELSGGKVQDAVEPPPEPGEPEDTPVAPGTPGGPEEGGEDLIGTTPAAEPTGEATGDLFDPSANSVDKVNAYLKGASDEEKSRVLAAEAAGKARSTILNA